MLNSKKENIEYGKHRVDSLEKEEVTTFLLQEQNQTFKISKSTVHIQKPCTDQL